jgi:hypothetical protein
MKVALAVTVGLLLALGLTTTPTHAAVTNTARVPPISTVEPDTLSTCLTGVNNSYEFYTWCQGTGPTSFRTVAYCTNGDAVIGVEYADGDAVLSYADCTMDGLNSTLDANWGILLCSNVNGTGTYEGYYDRSGDISGLFLNWGDGNITTGATTLCDYSTGAPEVINPNVAPTISSS